MLPLLAAVGTVPHTPNWGLGVAITMVTCNLIAFALGKQFIQIPDAEPASGTFLGLGLPALLGVTSLGHLLGAGAILGLANLGVL